MPRSRHSRRLRRSLPLVQPWLLWMLRTDGDAEYRFAHAPAASPRHERPSGGARLPHLQRRGLRAGSQPRWLSRRGRSSTDILARVEGEGAMFVKIEDGDVTDVKLRIYEPPRFFEAFLRGRAFTEAPDITARICGICPVAYQMSAVQAMEQICGVSGGRTAARASAPALLRRMDREPCTARVHAPCTRLPRLRQRTFARPRSSRVGRRGAGAEEDRQPADGPDRRAGDSSDQRARRWLVPRAAEARVGAARAESSNAPGRSRSTPSASSQGSTFRTTSRTTSS